MANFEIKTCKEVEIYHTEEVEVNGKFSINFFCSQCGKALEIPGSPSKIAVKDATEIYVRPCDYCLQEVKNAQNNRAV